MFVWFFARNHSHYNQDILVNVNLQMHITVSCDCFKYALILKNGVGEKGKK